MSAFIFTPGVLGSSNLQIAGTLPTSAPVIPDVLTGHMITNLWVDGNGQLADTRPTNCQWQTSGLVPFTSWTSQDEVGYGSWRLDVATVNTNIVYSDQNIACPAGPFQAIMLIKLTASLVNGEEYYPVYSTSGPEETFIRMQSSGLTFIEQTDILSTSIPIAMGYNAISWGRSADNVTMHVKVNRAASVSMSATTTPTMKSLTMLGAKFGTQAIPGSVKLLWMSSDPWDDTAMSTRVNEALTFFSA